MRAKTYPLLERCVEAGVVYGYRRAHKHVEQPTQQEITDAIVNAVMDAICEAFDFEDAPVQ